MTFAAERAARRLTLEQTAVELGLSRKSRGWLSEIERGLTDASLRLALRIERWSEGRVTAASVCSELRDDKPGLHEAVSVDDDGTMAPGGSAGAENAEQNISRTEGAAA